MNLWLLRHGEAVPTASSDAMRQLNLNGQRGATNIAQYLKDQPLDLILHSPYLRAKETAKIVVKQLDYKGKILELEDIIPESNPKNTVDLLSQYNEQHILVVSHQPLLGKLVSLLTQGNMQAQFPFTTAGLVLLKGDYICLDGMVLAKSFLAD